MPRYIVVNSAERGVGGLMTMPEDAAKMGMPPAWLGYIHTRDVDASTKALKAAGGAVHREPDDIPGVGRFAVVADPQGAAFMFLQPNGPDQPVVPATTPGHVGWHELYAADWQAAFDFYSEPVRLDRCRRAWTWARWASTRPSRPAPNPAAAS